MVEVKNKKITIIGAARSGLAVADLVLKLGGIAKVSDGKPDYSVSEGVVTEKGGHTKDFIRDSELLVISPGVRLDSQVVGWAKEYKIPVMGEVEFSYLLCPSKIIAITGSNGKTTTTTLIARILEKAGYNVCLCGNIGSPLASHVLNLKSSDIVVMEISSFQLESTVNFKPFISVWLNFSLNHLDRHKDLNEYFQAKKMIFKNQDVTDFAVLNAKQEEFKNFSKEIKSQIRWFNGDNSPKDISNPNYLAALTAIEALGVSENIAREVFNEFKGVEHRLEWVRNIDGVDYINDSKSTTAEAGKWAIEQISKPIILICGGSDKKIEYSNLKSLVSVKVREIIAIGQIRDQIKHTFTSNVPVNLADTLEEAVQIAKSKAKEGYSIVLSPMTASFDMFKDYEHRGRVFKEIVEKLK